MLNKKSSEIIDSFISLAGHETGIGIDFLSGGPQLSWVLLFSTVLFLIGIFGVLLISHNLIVTLMSLEIMLLGVSLDFLIISYYFMDVEGHIFALVLLTLAASESAIALALFINLYRVFKTLDMKKITKFIG